jgi:aspartate carbamoyltransferase regulatory subunit
MSFTMDDKHLKVNAIKNGTVIDHIPSRNLFKVISILRLDEIDTPITFGTNLESKKLNSKAIIKISDRYFLDEEINKIALVAPQAKFNIIKDYTVVEKRQVEVPDLVVGIAKCFNPKCITNFEQVTTKFHVVAKDPVQLKCHYCEKITHEDQVVIL